MFWQQVVKVGAGFVRGCTSSSTVGKEGERKDQEMVDVIVLKTFGELAGVAEGKEGWMSGRGFVGFCEYWMGFAERAGDIALLNRISELMRRLVGITGIYDDSTKVFFREHFICFGLLFISVGHVEAAEY